MMDKQASHADACVSKARLSPWKLHNFPNHTDMERGGSLRYGGMHVAEKVFLLCRHISSLCLFDVSFFNHHVLSSASCYHCMYLDRADEPNGTLQLLIGSHTFSFFINYEVSPGSSAELRKAPRGSCRLLNSSSTPQISSTAEFLTLLPVIEHSQHSYQVQQPSCMCEYDLFPP